MYKPQPPTSVDAFSTSDVTLIIPTIDTDEEAMHEAMRSWVLNQPHAIIIVTVGENLQKELEKIASRSIAADITTVLYVEKPANKRIQLVHGAPAGLRQVTRHAATIHAFTLSAAAQLPELAAQCSFCRALSPKAAALSRYQFSHDGSCMLHR